MAGVPIDSIADQVLATLRTHKKGSAIQLNTDLTAHECMGRIMRKEKVIFEGGRGWKGTYNVHQTAARQTAPFTKDTHTVPDLLVEGEVPHRHTTTNWPFDTIEEAVNRGPNKLVDVVLERQASATAGLADHMEGQFMGGPSSADDKMNVWGILGYWLTRATSYGKTHEKFWNINPTVAPNGRAGVNSVTYPRHANYAALYREVSGADLIQKVKRGFRRTNFQPVNGGSFEKGYGARYRCYTCEAVIEELEDIAESRNDNLQFDLAVAGAEGSPGATGRQGRAQVGRQDGLITVRSNPVIYVPFLDDETDDPFIALDMDDVTPMVLQGQAFKTSAPIRTDAHTAFAVYLDVTWNIFLKTLRRHALYTRTAA